MRKLFVIGIGAGDPDQVTVAAIKAMRAVDVFFVVGKGETKRELVEVRTRILREHVGEVRIVEVPDPPTRPCAGRLRGRRRRLARPARRAARRAVRGGRRHRWDSVWGDPSLYDSTLRVVDRVRTQISFDVEVIPGITSVQALAARHRSCSTGWASRWS